MPKLKKANIDNHPENHFNTDDTTYTIELEKKHRKELVDSNVE